MEFYLGGNNNTQWKNANNTTTKLFNVDPLRRRHNFVKNLPIKENLSAFSKSQIDFGSKFDPNYNFHCSHIIGYPGHVI